MGMIVAAISMTTVPVTVGVKTRRTQDSRCDRTSWKSEETRTSAASNGGPPAVRAAMQTAINAPEVPIRRM